MKPSEVRTYEVHAASGSGWESLNSLNDNDLQHYLLQGVSRTFALTIPQLPTKLSVVISNAYLLCRTIDTIEDETRLSTEQKKYFSEKFVRIVSGDDDPQFFSRTLYPLLSDQTLDTEKELVALIPRIVAITHSFDMTQQKSLARCVEIMSRGMVQYQLNISPKGLKTLSDHNAYCYHVAGVVGEMLTELFIHYSQDIGQHKNRMMHLAISFGQGLQMTNILKDIWEDLSRGVCWLPRDIFAKEGFDLDHLSSAGTSAEFRKGLMTLIGIAHGHLKNALEYTLTIPSSEKGIRRFCLWALGMAILTLRKIYQNQEYQSGNQVKISRKSVKATIALSNLFVKQDYILKGIFNIARKGLPYVPVS